MILSFANTSTKTERIWNGLRSKHAPPDIQKRGLDKLKVLNRVKSLDDLRNPPSNHLEALKRDRTGQHSIRINAE